MTYGATVGGQQYKQGALQAEHAQDQGTPGRVGNTAARQKEPRVRLKRFSEALHNIKQLGSEECPYCGSTNPNTGQLWVCHRCENAVYAAIIDTKQADRETMILLSEINEMVAAGDYGKADAVYKEVLAKRNEPAFIYSYALFNVQYSNSEVAEIRYDREGFMEENAEHRENASMLESKAMELFNKVVATCNKELAAGNGDAFLAHTLFMSSVKLGNLRTARRALVLLQEYNNRYIERYDIMVFAAELGDFKTVLKHAYALTGGAGMSVNAFYYAAWALFKLGKPKAAMQILVQLSTLIQNPSVNALISRIGRG